MRARRLAWDARRSRRKLAAFERGRLWFYEADWDLPSELSSGPHVTMAAQTPCAREFLYRVGGALLEPEFGYAILPPRTVLDESLPFSEMTRHFSRMSSFAGLPRFRDVHAVAHGTIRPRKLARAASMRHPFDTNYYHFTVDVMSRLELLARFGVPEDVPLVVSTALSRQKFFQEAIRQPALARRQWLVHTEFLEVEELYLPKPLDGGTPEGVASYRDLIGAPAPAADAGERLFIDRSPARGRAAANREELLPIIEGAGFRLLDADQLGLLEQSRIFSRCSVIAGFHGAGLTNIIFRVGAPLCVLELFPPRETSLEYALLARRLGYDYDYIRGTHSLGKERNSNYFVDPVALDRLLSRADRDR